MCSVFETLPLIRCTVKRIISPYIVTDSAVQTTQKPKLSTQQHVAATQPAKVATTASRTAVQPGKPNTQSPKADTTKPKPAVQPVRPATQPQKAHTSAPKPAVLPVRPNTQSPKADTTKSKSAVHATRPAPHASKHASPVHRRVTRAPKPATRQPWKIGVTKRPPVTKRTVNVKNCDDDTIRVKDDETLVGKIVVQNCNCERRFSNNATRLAAISSSVTIQLQRYFQKVYNTKVNYPTTVKVFSGNKTHTVFTYIVKVPKDSHGQAKEAMKHACKDEEVISSLFKQYYESVIHGIFRCI